MNMNCVPNGLSIAIIAPSRRIGIWLLQSIKNENAERIILDAAKECVIDVIDGTRLYLVATEDKARSRRYDQVFVYNHGGNIDSQLLNSVFSHTAQTTPFEFRLAVLPEGLDGESEFVIYLL